MWKTREVFKHRVSGGGELLSVSLSLSSCLPCLAAQLHTGMCGLLCQLLWDPEPKLLGL